jgi:hypothetical protein
VVHFLSALAVYFPNALDTDIHAEGSSACPGSRR